jgi:fatty acid desaturase
MSEHDWTLRPPPANSRDGSAAFVREVRAQISDLIEPDQRIYWVDFLTTMAVGEIGFLFASMAPAWSAYQLAGFVVAVLAFYRATVFTHEIAHARIGTLKPFTILWNLLCGIPFMMPSFMYGDHKAHHVNHSYGTANDAEYLPLALGTRLGLAAYFGQVFLVPILLMIRFMVLPPLTWLIPPLRPIVWERMSNIGTINWEYRREPITDPAERRAALWQEIGCFVYGASFVTLVIVGIVPWFTWLMFYLVFLCVTAINYVRTLTAHRYLSDGHEVTYLEQLLDTNTVPGHPILTELWAPLGMRYHALHHVVPSLPYHNMGIAHRRLMATLPADSPYRRTIRRGLIDAVRNVLDSIRAGSARLSSN